MTFDIHQQLFDDDGECDEVAYDAYVAALIDAFTASPEGAALPEVAWVDMVADYARTYFAQSLATLEPEEFDEIVWGLFPEKVSVEPTEGPAIVRELRAFWTFLGREYGLPNAPGCLAVVAPGAEEDLVQYLGDPQFYGMAKSFVMSGRAAGFDMTNERGLEAWSAAYNAALTRGTLADERRRADKADAARKAKRKRERAARKKGRR